MGNLSKIFRYENELGKNIIFDYPYGYMINKPVGIDAINISLTKASGFDLIGDIVQSAKIQSRPLNISGLNLNGIEGKERLLSVIRPDLKGRLYADNYYLDVYPTVTPSISADKDFSNFSCSFLAAYPYWVLDRIDSVIISGANSIELNNDGQVEVPFTVDFVASAQVVNPIITNVGNSQFLQIKKTMQAGEEIKIQINHTKTEVTSSVNGDIRGKLDLASDLFRMPIGTNILDVSADSGAENLKTTVSYQVEKVGIVV